MVNELELGMSRVGDFFDGYEETPNVKVTLERTERGISVTIPWSDPSGHFARWFLGDDQLMLPPGVGAIDRPVPKRVIFRDSHGAVLLIACRPRGYHTVAFGPGSGKLWASAAVMGVQGDQAFDVPHGVQSEISSLREWLGVTSWEVRRGGAGQPTDIEVRSVEIPTIRLGEYKDYEIEFRPGREFVPDRSSNTYQLNDLLRVTTLNKAGAEIEQHLDIHRGIRDLLVLSRWREESCAPVSVMRQDDPLIGLDGENHGAQWRKIVVPYDSKVGPPQQFRPHLIEFQDLGVNGTLSWLKLRDSFSRALDPVITSINLSAASPHTLLAHTGPGLEALGYLLSIRDGFAQERAGSLPLRKRLERIITDVDELLPFDGLAWARNTAATYNSLKHANRQLPDEIDVLNAWAESVFVVRTWVANELGISAQILKRRLELDRQPRSFRRI